MLVFIATSTWYNFTPDSLVKKLKGEIPSISPKYIRDQNLLGQAQILIKSQTKAEPPQPEADNIPATSVDNHLEDTGQTSSQPAADQRPSPSAQDLGSKPNRVPGEKWREVGDFFVSFGFPIDLEGKEKLHTRVYHCQLGESQEWEGIAGDELIDWMLKKSKLRQPVKPEVLETESAKTPSSTQARVEETVLVKLSDLWVSKVKTPVTVGDLPQVMSLRAESRINLSGPAAISLTHDQLSFTVELYLFDTNAHQSELAHTYSGQLIPNELSYEIQQDFSMPPIGRYQLFIIAKLLLPDVDPTHLQGPIIRVEPYTYAQP